MYTQFVQSLNKIKTGTYVKRTSIQNPKNPRFIQRLYRRNRRRAVRLIMSDSQQKCDIEPKVLASHFYPEGENFSPDLNVFKELKKAEAPVNLSHFSPEEVRIKLSKAENMVPGPDCLTFNHWRRADPDAKALSCIFNLCIKHEKIPAAWKESRTVFIPKNGGGPAPKDWRPISARPSPNSSVGA